MSNVVAALTPSPWDVWVEMKSCIALHCNQLHLHYEAQLNYEVFDVEVLTFSLPCYLNLLLNQTVI